MNGNDGTAVFGRLDLPFATIAAATYGFLETKGLVSCLADGAIAVGASLSPSNAVAGAVEVGVLAQGIIGNANQAGVDTEYRSVFINV